MADNYLEKRMEDLRSGRLRDSIRARKHIPVHPSSINRLSLAYPDMCIFIEGKNEDAISAFVEEFRKIGLKVAFLMTDTKRGYSLAQKCGARFYAWCEGQASQDIVDDILKHWGKLDFIIKIQTEKGISPHIREIARYTAFISHPDHFLIDRMSCHLITGEEIELAKEIRSDINPTPEGLRSISVISVRISGK